MNIFSNIGILKLELDFFHVTFCQTPLECHVLFEWPLSNFAFDLWVKDNK